MTAGPAQPVLLVNPRSGGGKAARFDLVAQCRARGIEAIMFEPGDDLTMLATAAVRDGADALGMAGGDGSQAAVAAVAAEHGLPYVCIPAGTRNHFALDLGIDATDVAGRPRRVPRRPGAPHRPRSGQRPPLRQQRRHGRLRRDRAVTCLPGPQDADGDRHAAGAGRAGCPAVRPSLQRAGRPCPRQCRGPLGLQQPLWRRPEAATRNEGRPRRRGARRHRARRASAASV